MNINPYANDDPFAEMAKAFPNADDVKPVTVVAAVKAPALLSEADYYDGQIKAARELFGQYEQAIKDMVEEAKALTVQNTAQEQKALDLGLPLDRLFKRIEEARISFVDGPNKYVKAVNSLAKHYQGIIDDGRRAVKDQLNGFARQKVLEAQRQAIEEQKARDAVRKAAEAEVAKLKKEAEKAGLTAPEIELPPMVELALPVAPKTVRSSEGKATTVKTWKFEITDTTQVPREYLMVDEKKVRAAVKDGVRNIPGVNIFEDTDTRFSS